MKITDHANETRALSLRNDEVLTEAALVKALLATDCYTQANAELIASDTFNALEASAVVYRNVERYVPTVA